jgi:hypothetical protein
MTIGIRDLFAGISSSDATGALLCDDAFLGATDETFAGADSDVLMSAGVEASDMMVADESFHGVSDDVDVIYYDAEGDSLIDVSDDMVSDTTEDGFLGDGEGDDFFGE